MAPELLVLIEKYHTCYSPASNVLCGFTAIKKWHLLYAIAMLTPLNNGYANTHHSDVMPSYRILPGEGTVIGRVQYRFFKLLGLTWQPFQTNANGFHDSRIPNTSPPTLPDDCSSGLLSKISKSLSSQHLPV